MKKLLLFAIGGLTLALFWGNSASAATSITLSPAEISAEAGKTFMVAVKVIPSGDANVTVKLELDFPADLLEIQSFGPADKWMTLTQPGYDLIDNQAGRLIKTAGYPNGTVNSTTFGTISFLVKKTGKGVITTKSQSLALDSANKNIFSGQLSQIAFSAPAKPVAKPASNPASYVKPKPNAAPSAAETIANPEAAETSAEPEIIAETGEETELESAEAAAATSEKNEETIAKNQNEETIQAGEGETSTTSSATARDFDWTTLVIGIANGALLMLVIYGVRSRRRKTKE